MLLFIFQVIFLWYFVIVICVLLRLSVICIELLLLLLMILCVYVLLIIFYFQFNLRWFTNNCWHLWSCVNKKNCQLHQVSTNRLLLTFIYFQIFVNINFYKYNEIFFMNNEFPKMLWLFSIIFENNLYWLTK